MMIINLFGLTLIALIIWWFWIYKPDTQAQTNATGLVILVSDGVYSPKKIKIEAGRSQIIQFLRKDATPCAETIIFPDIEVSENLPLGKTESIVLPPLSVGKYEFHCPMKMYSGTLIVE